MGRIRWLGLWEFWGFPQHTCGIGVRRYLRLGRHVCGGEAGQVLAQLLGACGSSHLLILIPLAPLTIFCHIKFAFKFIALMNHV